MALCHITGKLYIPDGSDAANRRIEFQKLASDVLTDDYAGAVVPEPIYSKTDADGNVDAHLITGYYIGRVLDRRGGKSYTFKATVPDQSTANIADLINAADPILPMPSWLQEAWQARDEAEDAADRSEDAANESRNIRDEVMATNFADLSDLLSSVDPLPIGTIVTTRAEGYIYEVAASGATDHHLTTAGGVKLRVSTALGEVNILMFGADPTGVADSQPAFAAANTYRKPCFVPKGRYRLNTGVPLSTGMKFYGVRGGDVSNPDNGSVLVQYGQQAFIGDENLRWAVVSGFSFDLQASVQNAYTVAFALKSHRECRFEDFYFIRYTDATIMERIPQNATTNSVDNVYQRWLIETCRHVCVTIGQDGWGTSFQGDGTATVIDTGDVWPEQFNSSVAVFKENFQRNFQHLEVGTDYAVTYPSGNLRVTLTAPASNNERVHIFPAQPRADSAAGKQRRPFSNNTWREIKTRYGVYGHGFQDLRWVDAENYSIMRMVAANDGVMLFRTNPSRDRTCEAGDFNTYHDCVMTYQGDVDASTVTGWSFGPGSLQMTGTAIMCDLRWVHGGVNRALNNNSAKRVQLTGNVSTTSGLPVVTGAGGVRFRSELTLMGDSVDHIEIDGVVYQIASIDSGTQLTLATNAQNTLSNVDAFRINTKNANSYDFQWASMGTGAYNNHRGGVGRSEYGSSTEYTATVLIPSGQTAVTVPHNLWRAPSRSSDEVQVTALSNFFIGGVARYPWVSHITEESVQVNLSDSYTSGLTLKLKLKLGPLN